MSEKKTAKFDFPLSFQETPFPPPPLILSFPSSMGQESFIYSFVARGTMVLAEYTQFTGNFPAIAAQCLHRLPSANNKFTYKCDHHIFNFLLHDGYGHSQLYFYIYLSICFYQSFFLMLDLSNFGFFLILFEGLILFCLFLADEGI